jgi:hypothetical protein
VDFRKFVLQEKQTVMMTKSIVITHELSFAIDVHYFQLRYLVLVYQKPRAPETSETRSAEEATNMNNKDAKILCMLNCFRLQVCGESMNEIRKKGITAGKADHGHQQALRSPACCCISD